MREFLGGVTFRIGLAVTLIVVAVTAAQALAMRTVLLQQTLEVRRHIVEEGVALARLVARGDAADPGVLRRELAALESVAVVFYDREGAVIGASRDDVDYLASLDLPTRLAADAAAGQPHFVVPLESGQRTEVIARTDAGGPVAYVGVFEDRPVLAMQSIRRWVWLAAVLVALLTSLVVTLVVSRGVRRSAGELELVVRRMAQGDLSVRLPDFGEHEVGRVLRDFNRMADVVELREGAFRVEDGRRRRLMDEVSGNLALEVPALLAQLESLAEEVETTELTSAQDTVGRAIAQMKRLASLAEDLTFLTRLEREGIALDPLPVDLAEFAEIEAEAFGPTALLSDVSVKVEGKSCIALIDRARFGRLVRILLLHAARRAQPGSVVRIAVAEGSFEVIAVARSQSSNAIEQEELGLAIAHLLVKAHGGELTMRSAQGESFVAKIALPPAE
jgi:signal transduction histidine kinase